MAYRTEYERVGDVIRGINWDMRKIGCNVRINRVGEEEQELKPDFRKMTVLGILEYYNQQKPFETRYHRMRIGTYKNYFIYINNLIAGKKDIGKAIRIGQRMVEEVDRKIKEEDENTNKIFLFVLAIIGFIIYIGFFAFR